MLVKIGATLFLILASMSIGFGVYWFEHRQVTEQSASIHTWSGRLEFCRELVFGEHCISNRGMLAELFKELEGSIKT